MNLRPLLAELIAAALLVAGYAHAGEPAPAKVLGWWHSPKGGCAAAIIEQIDAAKESIDYRMYNFTLPEIGDALIRAHKRKVNVRIMVDKKEARKLWSQAQRCATAGLQVYVDGKEKIVHNKARVFDKKLLMFGSFNDTKSAENFNSEELVLMICTPLVEAFLDDFESHLKHAERLGKKA